LQRLFWIVLFIVSLFSITVSAQDAAPDNLLANMTLEQKVGQMFMFTFYGRPMNEPARNVLRTWQPGFIGLFPSNLGTPEQVTNLTNDIQQTLIDGGGIPAFIGVDQEGGLIAHLKEGFTTWPVPMLLTATQDEELAYEVGAGMAAEMIAVGINMDFAPVADLNTNRFNPIIGRRSFGSDAALVRPILAAYIKGMQGAGVLATAKHFPGHGDTSADSHTELPVVEHDLTRLESVELKPFAAAMDAGVGAIMVAHIWFPALDPTPNMPASLSSAVVTTLVRDQLGYTGLVMPDAMDMDAIDTVYDSSEAAIAAIKAGHDIVIPGAHISPEAHIAAMQAVVDAVRSGDIPESRIDASVQRILAAKARFGVLEWQKLDAGTSAQRMPLAQNATLIDQVFREGVSVVRDPNGLVPLQGTVGIVYPGTQPSLWTACNRREGVKPLAINVSPNGTDISGAVWLAGQVDHIVVFTVDAETSSEQEALVEALPAEKTIVVALQSPYDALVMPDIAAYVVTYSPLRPAYDAACGVLFGDYPANGQMAVSLK
jgi:beta-N-acetylhexosaminidase